MKLKFARRLKNFAASEKNVKKKKKKERNDRPALLYPGESPVNTI